MKYHNEQTRVPGLDEFILANGIVCAGLIILIALIVFRNRLTPTLLVTIASAPGFVVQTIFALQKVSMLSGLVKDLSAASLSYLMLQAVFLFVLNFGYCFNWLPFLAFIVAVILYRRDRFDEWSNRPITATCALTSGAVLLSYFETHNRIQTVAYWITPQAL